MDTHNLLYSYCRPQASQSGGVAGENSYCISQSFMNLFWERQHPLTLVLEGIFGETLMQCFEGDSTEERQETQNP